jgi:hypothetical protein
MRTLGWALGGFFLLDALVDLLGGEGAMRGLRRGLADRLPAPVGHALADMTDVNPTALRTMGVLNLLAGVGLVLLTLFGSRTVREVLVVEEAG